MKQHTIERPRVAAPGEPHLACVLLLDTSGSMDGEPINNLSNAINNFKEKVCKDEMSRKRIDICIIEFNDHANVIQDFVPISEMAPVSLEAGGCTAMGEAVLLAIDKVKERNRFYDELGVEVYKPWIFMITDGEPTDDITQAAERIAAEESKGSHGKLKFFALGVPGYDGESLFKLTKRVMALEDTDFEGIFNWMSESMTAISVSKVGESVKLSELPDNARIPPDEWGD